MYMYVYVVVVVVVVVVTVCTCESFGLIATIISPPSDPLHWNKRIGWLFTTFDCSVLWLFWSMHLYHLKLQVDWNLYSTKWRNRLRSVPSLAVDAMNVEGNAESLVFITWSLLYRIPLVIEYGNPNPIHLLDADWSKPLQYHETILCSTYIPASQWLESSPPVALRGMIETHESPNIYISYT